MQRHAAGVFRRANPFLHCSDRGYRKFPAQPMTSPLRPEIEPAGFAGSEFRSGRRTGRQGAGLSPILISGLERAGLWLPVPAPRFPPAAKRIGFTAAAKKVAGRILRGPGTPGAWRAAQPILRRDHCGLLWTASKCGEKKSGGWLCFFEQKRTGDRAGRWRGPIRRISWRGSRPCLTFSLGAPRVAIFPWPHHVDGGGDGLVPDQRPGCGTRREAGFGGWRFQSPSHRNGPQQGGTRLEEKKIARTIQNSWGRAHMQRELQRPLKKSPRWRNGTANFLGGKVGSKKTKNSKRVVEKKKKRVTGPPRSPPSACGNLKKTTVPAGGEPWQAQRVGDYTHAEPRC